MVSYYSLVFAVCDQKKPRDLNKKMHQTISLSLLNS